MSYIIFIGFIILTVVFILYTRYMIGLLMIPGKLLKAKRIVEVKEGKAIKLLTSILAIDRGNPEANWLMANIYIKKHQYILAQMYLFEIIANNSFTAEINEKKVRETLAYIYRALGEINKALTQYYILKEHNQLTLDALIHAVKLNIEYNNNTEAADLLNTAIQLYGEKGEFYYYAGLIDFNKGNIKSAELKLKKAVSKGFETAEINLLLGKIYFITRKFKLAVEYLNKLPEEYLNSVEIEKMLGECFYYLKNYNTAISVLKRIVDNKKITVSADTHFILGCAYESSGYINEAVKVWENIVKNFSSYKPAKEKLFFYKHIAVDDKIKNIITAPRSVFFDVNLKLLDKLHYIVKETIYEDDKNIAYICSLEKDLHNFFSYLIYITRQTAPIDRKYINEKLILLNKYRSKFLIIIAPYFSEEAHRFAKSNSVSLFDYSIYKENKVV